MKLKSLQKDQQQNNQAEDWTSDLEDKIMEITTAEQNKGKGMKRIEDSLRYFQDNIKCTNIPIIGVPEEEDKMKQRKYLKRLQLKTCLIWERKQLMKSINHRESITG